MKRKLNKFLNDNSGIKKILWPLIGLFPFSAFKSKNYKRHLKTLEYFETLSKDEIEKWKYDSLKKVINNAYENIPFYNKLYRANNFNPSSFKSLQDIELIPTISKKDIKNNLNRFISKKFNKNKLVEKYSGGSTAAPLKFFLDEKQDDLEPSYYEFIWKKYGYNFGKDKCVVIKGDKIARTKNGIFSLSKYNPVMKTLTFDSDYLNKIDYIGYYLEDINNLKSEVLFGYPSSIYQLAKTIKASGRKAPKFRLILLASENTYTEQNNFMKEVFGSEDIFFHYGHSEQVLAAYKIFNSNELAFIPLYGHVELINDNKNILGRDDTSVGELVGTNYSMGFPFIRFKTNDYAVNSTSKNSMFSDNCVVNSIEGRLQEYIVTKDKRLVSLCTMGGAHFSSISKALETQYIQKNPGFLTFHVVENKEDPFTKMDIKNIKREMDEKFEYSIDTSVKIVEKITKLPSNKKSMIKQYLNINEFLG